MGNNTSNPIRLRLFQALEAIPAAEPARHDLAALTDEPALRDWILRNHKRLGLDPVWLLTGVEQPGRPATSDESLDVPVFSAVAVDSRTGHWRPLVRERIRLPASLVCPGRFVIRMETRAMEPRLRLGAYLVVDEGQTAPPLLVVDQEPAQAAQNPIFAVDVPGEGLVVRLACLDDRRQRLVLTGLDPSSPPYCLPRQADYRVVGRVIWVAQTL